MSTESEVYEMIDEHRQSVLAIAEAIAPGWERRRPFIEATTAPVCNWLVDALAPQPGDTVLELAAGAGDVGFAAAAHLGDAGRLLTTDVSPAMLDVARRRAAELGLDNVDFRVMDAEQIELEDGSVDGILCRFAYMLMPDPQTALVEARRVLRLGGRLALAVWGPPERNPFFSLIGMALVRRGHLPPPDPSQPGIFTLADPDRLGVLFEGAGFAETRLADVSVTFRLEGIDEYLAVIADTAGPLGLALRALDVDERAAIANELREPFSRFWAAGGYGVPGVALAACVS
jgi:ubiquinone/menaquinone biosynthesis C-methylase UbiE